MSESVDSIKFVIEDLRKWANNNRDSGKESVYTRMDTMITHLKYLATPNKLRTLAITH